MECLSILRDTQQKLDVILEKLEKLLKNNLLDEIKNDPKIKVFQEIENGEGTEKCGIRFQTCLNSHTFLSTLQESKAPAYYLLSLPYAGTQRILCANKPIRLPSFSLGSKAPNNFSLNKLR